MIIQVDCDEMEAAILTTYAKKKGLTVSDFMLGAALSKIINDCESIGVHTEKTEEQILDDIINNARRKEKSKLWKIMEILMGV